MMKQHYYSMILAVAVCAFGTTGAFAQGRGIVYPTVASSEASSSSPKGSAQAPSASVAVGVKPVTSPLAVSAIAPPTQPASSPPRGAVSGVTALPPLAVVSAPPQRPAAGPVPAAAQSGTAPAGAAPLSVPASPVQTASPSSTARPAPPRSVDGPRVITARVTPSMADAEAALASQLAMPSLSGRSSAPASSPESQPTASSSPSILAGAARPLPKWVTQGNDRAQGQSRLVVAQGVTEIVKIARNFPNRFVSPFESAEVVTTDESLIHDGVGGAVVVATASDKPVGIFIQDRHSDRAIPLVLIPEDIPQRELRLVLDDGWSPPVLRNAPEASTAALPTAQSDYVEYIKAVMRSLAKGDIPDGHAIAPLQPELAPNCQIPGVTMRVGQMLEGTLDRVVVYLARNETRVTVPVQESGCYRAGVLAAAAFPFPVLEPGQSTEFYVLMRKEAAEARQSSKRRPSLLQ